MRLFIFTKFFRGMDNMFIGEIDKCTHILTAYISSSYDYCNFLDTQLDDFISEYGETCLHQVLLLVSRYN